MLFCLQVSRAAEECATTLAHSIPAEQCIRVLNPIIQTADYPVNLAAIKMLTKVCCNYNTSACTHTHTHTHTLRVRERENQKYTQMHTNKFHLQIYKNTQMKTYIQLAHTHRHTHRHTHTYPHLLLTFLCTLEKGFCHTYLVQDFMQG